MILRDDDNLYHRLETTVGCNVARYDQSSSNSALLYAGKGRTLRETESAGLFRQQFAQRGSKSLIICTAISPIARTSLIRFLKVAPSCFTNHVSCFSIIAVGWGGTLNTSPRNKNRPSLCPWKIWKKKTARYSDPKPRKVQLRTLSSPADPEWPGSSEQPPFGLAGRSPVPESPQSPAPAALWSVVPPGNGNSCLSFCQQTHPRPPEEAALWPWPHGPGPGRGYCSQAEVQSGQEPGLGPREGAHLAKDLAHLSQFCCTFGEESWFLQAFHWGDLGVDWTSV